MSATETGIDTRPAPWLCDPYSRALADGRGPLFLRRPDGWMLRLDVERWCAGTDAADESVLERCEGDTLDAGCGPGRMVVALAARGRRALGVDMNPVAVSRAVEAGGRAVCASVFDPLPGEGGWRTALLVDGNIGIGGAPGGLLARMREVVLPGGLLIVETAAHEVHECVTVQVTDGRGNRVPRSRGRGSAPAPCGGARGRAGGSGRRPGRCGGAGSRHCARLGATRHRDPSVPR